MIDRNLREEPPTLPVTTNKLFSQFLKENDKKESKPAEQRETPAERNIASMFRQEQYLHQKSQQNSEELSVNKYRQEARPMIEGRPVQERMSVGEGRQLGDRGPLAEARSLGDSRAMGEARDVFGRVSSENAVRQRIMQELMPPPAHTQPFVPRGDPRHPSVAEGISAAFLEAHQRDREQLQREARPKSPTSTPPSLIREKTSPAPHQVQPVRPHVPKPGKTPNLPPTPPLIATSKAAPPAGKGDKQHIGSITQGTPIYHLHPGNKVEKSQGSIMQGTPVYHPATNETAAALYKAQHEAMLRQAQPARSDSGSITRGTPVSHVPRTQPQEVQREAYDPAASATMPGMYPFMRPGMPLVYDPAVLEQMYRQHQFYPAHLATAAYVQQYAKDSPFESSRHTLIADYVTSQQMQNRRGGASTPQDKDSRTASPRSQPPASVPQGALPHMYYMPPQVHLLVPSAQVPMAEPGQVVRTPPLQHGEGRERENPSPREPWACRTQAGSHCVERKPEYSSPSPQRQNVITHRSIVTGTVIHASKAGSPRVHDTQKPSDRYSPASSRKSVSPQAGWGSLPHSVVSPRTYADGYGDVVQERERIERDRLEREQREMAKKQQQDAMARGMYWQTAMQTERGKAEESQRRIGTGVPPEFVRMQAEQRWRREEEERRIWDAREKERVVQQAEKERLERTKIEQQQREEQQRREEMIRREYLQREREKERERERERQQYVQDKERDKVIQQRGPSPREHDGWRGGMPARPSSGPGTGCSVDREPGEIERVLPGYKKEEANRSSSADGGTRTAADLIDAIINQQMNRNSDVPEQRSHISMRHQQFSEIAAATKRRSPEGAYSDAQQSPYKPHKYQKVDPLRVKHLEAEVASSSREPTDYQQRQEAVVPSTSEGKQGVSSGSNLLQSKTITLGEHIEAIITQDYRRGGPVPGDSQSSNQSHADPNKRKTEMDLQKNMFGSRIHNRLMAEGARKNEEPRPQVWSVCIFLFCSVKTYF